MTPVDPPKPPRGAIRRAASGARRQARYARGSLAHAGLRRLLFGYFGYCLARKASRVAIVVYSFDAQGVRGAALIAVIQLIPAALVAPFGSAFAERIDPARALALGYLVQAVSLMATGLAMLLGAPLPWVAICATGAACAFALTRPVYLAMLPDVVDYPDELALGNAGSVWVDGVASVVGPLLAGLGLAVVGAGPVLGALGVVCLVSAAASLRVHARRRQLAGRTSLRDLVGGGMTALRDDHDVATLAILTAMQYTVVGLLDVLLVLLVSDVMHRDSASVGILAAAIGVGSTLGAFGSIVLSGRPQLGHAILVGAFITGLPVIVLGLGPALLVSAALLAGYGVGKSVVTVAEQTLLQRTVSDDVTTRVFGIQEGLVQAATAAGAALGPLLVLLVGPRGALVVAGVLLPIATILARPSLARLDARAVVPGPVFALLRMVPFMAGLPLRTVEQMARNAEVVSVPAGSVVIEQGEVGDRYYVIEAGAAEVVIDGQRAAELREGAGFGEIALLRDIPRTATIVATSPLQLVAVDRESFLTAVTGVPRAHEAAHRLADEHLDADARRMQSPDAGIEPAGDDHP